MAFLAQLSRDTSAMILADDRSGPIRTIGYGPRLVSAAIGRSPGMSGDIITNNRAMEFNSPTETRMRFTTANRPTQAELAEFERQFLNSISPRVPLSEISTTSYYEVTFNHYITVLSGRVAYSPENNESVVIRGVTAEKILSTMPCCLYGSRGIGLENADDYDIAISIEDPKYLEFINYLERVGVKRVDIKNYVNSTPESGYYGLYRFQGAKEERIDLLVLYLDEDVDVIRSTITDLKRIPSYFLTNKQQRITMYNQGLRYRGWKPGVKVRNDYRTSEDAQAISLRNWASQATTLRSHTVNYTGNGGSTNPWTETFGPRGAEEW